MTGHPALCTCFACGQCRETVLRAEVARQDAEIAALTERYVPLVEEVERLTREREDYREKRANEVEALRAQNAGVGEQLVKAIDDIATLRAEVERLTREVEESSIARTIHFGEAERLRERVAALTADVCPRCGATLRDPVGGGKP